MNLMNLKEAIKSRRRSLEQEKGKRSQLQAQIKQSRMRVREINRILSDCEQAQEIIQTVAQATQQELEYHIGELVSLALNSLFPDLYEFRINFALRRGKTEADLLLIKNGEEMSPLHSEGGGIVDIISFALKISLWNLQRPRTRNTIILDEPFKFLSADLQNNAGEMMRTISKKLGIQIIMISHIKELIESADKVFKVRQNKEGKSICV